MYRVNQYLYGQNAILSWHPMILRLVNRLCILGVNENQARFSTLEATKYLDNETPSSMTLLSVDEDVPNPFGDTITNAYALSLHNCL